MSLTQIKCVCVCVCVCVFFLSAELLCFPSSPYTMTPARSRPVYGLAQLLTPAILTSSRLSNFSTRSRPLLRGSQQLRRESQPYSSAFPTLLFFDMVSHHASYAVSSSHAPLCRLRFQRFRITFSTSSRISARVHFCVGPFSHSKYPFFTDYVCRLCTPSSPAIFVS